VRSMIPQNLVSHRAIFCAYPSQGLIFTSCSIIIF